MADGSAPPGASPPPAGSSPPNAPTNPGSSRPHRRPDRVALVLVVGLVAASLVLVGGLVYFQDLLPGNCTDWWVYCPLGPSAYTPLGTALGIGTGTGACPAGNGTSLADCTYTFRLATLPAGSPYGTSPSALDLTFALVDSTGAPLSSSFVVNLTDPSGHWIGTWNSSASSWAIVAGGPVCGASDCLSAPLANGDTFLLRATPNGGLPYSHQGDDLTAQAIGGGFSGSVDAPIE